MTEVSSVVAPTSYSGIKKAVTLSNATSYEFGGPLGALALMIWSHYILLYFWYCLETSSGRMIFPTSTDDFILHCHSFYELFLTKGIPSAFTWIAYLFFFFFTLLLAGFMPGLTMYGLKTAPHGVRLPYHCNGYSCYYACLFGAIFAHKYGLFPLTYIADHFGEVLIASIVIGDLTSLWWYLYGLAFADEYNGKAAHTGSIIYDFFMGTHLYPRIGEVDIKMVAECRWSWLTLMFLTLSCAVKQYETTGTLSPQMLHMLVAHWLYSNATAKGEHCIPCTWDMFHENFGWMLNFWNIAGVPFLYCFQSFYILKNQEAISAQYPAGLAYFNMVLLLLAYYTFDTANSQKAMIKISQRRNTFPTFSWGTLKDPLFLKTPKGNILVSGWYGFARKMQYSGDILMALSWGLACGFGSLLPYFYCLFFTCMIIHRQTRDEVRCGEKYGHYWEIYTSSIPNVFIPRVSTFVHFLFTGESPSFPAIEESNRRFDADSASTPISAGEKGPGSTSSSSGRKAATTPSRRRSGSNAAAAATSRSTTPSKKRTTEPATKRSGSNLRGAQSSSAKKGK